MSVPSFLITLAILLCAAWYVARPLVFQPRRKGRGAALHAGPAAAGGHHDEVLLALRDLEFDHRLGKVTDEDYGLLRTELMAQAAATLKQETPVSDDRIEAQVRARRERRPCPACGRPLHTVDRFCPACGAARGSTQPARVQQ